MGLFISFEGGEGSGKSTQAALLAERLQQAGRRVAHLREPGSTGLGDYLRRWLKSNDRAMTHEAELFLFTAARAELVRRVVKPALKDGEVVVCDRYADSTMAYQGYGRGLPLAAVQSANRLAAGGVWPDVTFLLDGDPQALLLRARAHKQPCTTSARPPIGSGTAGAVPRRAMRSASSARLRPFTSESARATSALLRRNRNAGACWTQRKAWDRPPSRCGTR